MLLSKRHLFLELKNTFLQVKRYQQIVKFLLARLLYNDGLTTIFAFGGIYAAGTFGFSFQEIMIFGIVLNITAGIGAYLMGFLDDRIGGIPNFNTIFTEPAIYHCEQGERLVVCHYLLCSFNKSIIVV